MVHRVREHGYIVPKAYHKDLQKFKKPIKVIVEDIALGMTTISSSNKSETYYISNPFRPLVS